MHRQHPGNLGLVAMPFIHTISLPCDGDLGVAGITSQHLLQVWRRGYSTLAGSPRRQEYRSQLFPTIDAVSKEEPSQYRPFILRNPVLAGIFLLTLALIGMIEFACRTLPSSTSNSAQAASKHLLDVRNDNVWERELMTLVKDGADIVPTSKYLARTSTINATLPASALSSDYLNLGMTSSMAQSSYLSLITTSDITPTTSPTVTLFLTPTSILPGSTLSNNYLNRTFIMPESSYSSLTTTSTTTLTTSAAASRTSQGGYLSLSSKVTISTALQSSSLGLTATKDQNSYLSLAIASTISLSTSREGYVHLISTVITSSPTPAASAAKSQHVDLTQTAAAST
ncbi:MAG: hypothetical protein M1835_003478, partial [Candelina submexicana]